MPFRPTPVKAGDSVYVTNRKFRADDQYGTKGKVVEVSGLQVKVRLLTSGKTEVFDSRDVSGTGMF